MFRSQGHFASLELDVYGRIKLVNYIRSSVRQAKCPACEHSAEDAAALRAHLPEHCPLAVHNKASWIDNTELLFPAWEGDPFLFWGALDDDDAAEVNVDSAAASLETGPTTHA